MTPEAAIPLGAVETAAERALVSARSKLLGMRGQWYALLAFVWIATLGALVAGVAIDQPILAAVPMLGAGVAVAIIKAPLRYTLMALMFLGLVLENPSERPGDGKFKTPIYIVGALLLTNLNVTIPVGALKFSGIDMVVGLLFIIWLYRKVTGQREVSRDTPQVARPVASLALVSGGTVFFLIAWGLATRGHFTNSLWQTQKLFYVPIIFTLMCGFFRGPKDHKALGVLIIIAATYKGLLGMYVRAKLGEEPPYVLTHSDSMLFATAYCIPLVRLLIAGDRRSGKLCLLVLPVLTGGMIANNRRLVWVEVTIVLIIVLVMTPWTPIKRALVRFLVVISPFMPVYLAAGWNSGSGIFKPVKTFRSVVDSKSDRSSETRDIENYNLIFTLINYPIVPLGFGHEYIEQVVGDDISSSFPQYRFIPHNSVLGLWAFCGVLGITGIWMVLGVTVFMAARSFRRSRDVDHQTAAICSIGVVSIYLMQAYGDMGLVSWIGVFLVAPAMVVAGKLAVATGAWPAKLQKPAGQPEALPMHAVITGIHKLPRRPTGVRAS